MRVGQEQMLGSTYGVIYSFVKFNLRSANSIKSKCISVSS